MEDNITILFRKYISHEISPSEVEELKAFIAQSDDHLRLFTDFLSLSKAERQASLVTRIDKESRWQAVVDKIRLRRRRRQLAWVASAAALAVIVVSATIMFLGGNGTTYDTMEAAMEAKAQDRAVITINPGETVDLSGAAPTTLRDVDGKPLCEAKEGSVTYYARPARAITNKIEVMEGSTYRITLPDGSKIVLNSGASLTYTVGGNQREVTLDGEGFFEVRHDVAHPFTVHCTDGTEVKVLGTKFNVNARHGSPTVVTVETGRVAVTSNGHRTVLTSGEQAVATPGEDTQLSEVDAELYTSWADGIYEFSDVPMQTIARQLSLWYGIDIEFAREDLKERKFTGALLRDEKLGYSLGLLKEVSGINFKMQDGRIIIH